MPRLAVLSLLLIFALPLCAQDDNAPVDAARAEKLIKQLGDEEWAVRERASRELIGIGDPAREALHGALEHDDPEIRVRASNALILIGEEFAYAVECAVAESEHLREHGRAALMNLFKIDDSKNLRMLSQQETQTRWRRYDNPLNVMAPPVIALARVQARSGFPILVADEVREEWDSALKNPTATISIRGPDQIAYVRDAIRTWLAGVLGNLPPDKQLVPWPMRIGRTNFLYVTRVGSTSGLARRCGEQLVSDLLKEGEPSARAAVLLADGASSDSEAADRIREQYVLNSGLTRLMWLALALGTDEKTTERVRARDHADALGLLRTHSWKVMELGAKYLMCLEPEARGKLLSPIVQNSNDSLVLVSAIWIAQNSPLTLEARGRVMRLVSSKQDMLSAAAARWFAGEVEVTDEELAAVWQAGEFQLLDSRFYKAALELVKRPDIGKRLVEHARATFQGTFQAQQARHALAAAVLNGRTTPADLEVAVNILTGARKSPRLAAQMAELFIGCSELTPKAEKKFQSRLYDSEAMVRSVYMSALRNCESALRLKIAKAAIGDRSTTDDDVTLPKHELHATLALRGILAGAGDSDALDDIIAAVEGEDAELAKVGGAAFVDAFDGDALFNTLEDLNNREGIVNGALAALEGYMEICRRAARSGDRVTFRKAYGIAFNMPILNQNWNLRQELTQIQNTLGTESTVDKVQPLPPDPVLGQLDVAIK